MIWNLTQYLRPPALEGNLDQRLAIYHFRFMPNCQSQNSVDRINQKIDVLILDIRYPRVFP